MLESSAVVAAIREALFGPSSPLLRVEATLPGVIRGTDRWTRNEVPRDVLGSALVDLACAIEAAVAAGRADLASAHGIDTTLRDLAVACQGALERVLTLMRTLARSVERDDPTRAASDARNLESARQSLEARQEAVRAWLAESRPTCVGCGFRGDAETCPACGLPMLIPEAPDVDETPDSVALGPTYVTVYQACAAAAAGGDPALLAAALDALENEVRATLAPLAGLREPEEIHLVRSHLERILAGVARMREFARSRAIGDLNHGWAVVAGAAAELQALLHYLLAAEEQPLERTRDVVEISGD